MQNFVSSGNFTKMIAIIVISLITIGSGVLLGVVLLQNLQVNNAVLISLGGALGSGLTYFAKASGVSDGASIVQNAVNSVTGPMQDAINSTPPTVSIDPTPARVLPQTPVQG